MLRGYVSNKRPAVWRFICLVQPKYNPRITVLQKERRRRYSKIADNVAPQGKENAVNLSTVASLAKQPIQEHSEEDGHKVIVNETGDMVHNMDEIGANGKPVSKRMQEFRHKLKMPMDNLNYQVHPHCRPDTVPEWPNGVNPHTGEVGGPKGLEPTRYGDWEYNGIACDF